MTDDWLCDGTFDISPTLYKQLFTIHAIYKTKTLPLVYSFLPDKETETYSKLFKMLLDHVKPPLSLNCDFEKAIHLAANNIFENCSIYGCFFHLSQNWYKRLGKLSLNKYFFSQKEFRKGFKMCQSLAYLPVNIHR